LLIQNADIFVLNSGTGDVSRDGPGGITETHGETYSAVLHEEFFLLRRYHPKARIIWLTALPVDERVYGERMNQDLNIFNRLAMETAAGVPNIEIIDVFRIFWPIRHEALMPDGLHLTPKNYEKLADIIAQRIVAGP